MKFGNMNKHKFCIFFEQRGVTQVMYMIYKNMQCFVAVLLPLNIHITVSSRVLLKLVDL